MAVVKVREVDGVGVITLDDPVQRNAITLALADELIAAVDELQANPAVHAVVLTGAGSTFCAGADRRLLAAAEASELTAIYAAFLHVRRCSLPTVAAVNGPAVGAGLNLALACDLRVAAVSAVFDARFVRIPIHPGGGCTWMLRELAGPQTAAALTVFGAKVDGAQAARMGLAWDCVPDDQLLGTALQMCAVAARAPRELVAQIKATLTAGESWRSHDEALEYELREQLSSMDTAAFRDAFAGLR
ncbi:enoyl-CoA hydratase-related protein [Mycolicibacterium stellerae]|uniref:enoyl-CoA hydratase-related protein n=1 Tax=Mycolicibacterium stellerae TaxID=2358193 RepID=UPI000F0BDBBB|nr:enoyl-CoA hydratase-related protein [Mycolicibacterium stellerae]